MSSEPSEPNRNLFVAGIGPEIDDAKLAAAFAEFGVIHSAKVMLDIHRGYPRGFGFVLFENIQNAIHAKEHHKTPWTVLFARHDAYNVVQSSCRIYARNIPNTLSTNDLRSFFGTFGSISSICVREDSDRTPRPFKGEQLQKSHVCFLKFATPEEAKRCVDETYNVTLPGGHGPLLTKLAENSKIRDERRSRAIHRPTEQSSSSRRDSRGEEEEPDEYLTGNRPPLPIDSPLHSPPATPPTHARQQITSPFSPPSTVMIPNMSASSASSAPVVYWSPGNASFMTQAVVPAQQTNYMSIAPNVPMVSKFPPGSATHQVNPSIFTVIPIIPGHPLAGMPQGQSGAEQHWKHYF